MHAGYAAFSCLRIIIIIGSPNMFLPIVGKTNALVQKLTQEQRYDSALSLAKKGLSIAEKESGKTSLAYAVILNNPATETSHNWTWPNHLPLKALKSLEKFSRKMMVTISRARRREKL